MSRWLVVALAALLSSGCSISRLYSGVPLRGDPTQIVEGKSTRREVLALLGPPEQIAHQASGDVFIYRYRRVNASSITIRDPFFTNQLIFSYSRQFDDRDLLVVLFDFTGVVEAVAHRDDIKDMPWL